MPSRMTFRRKYRSSRNAPASICACRSRLVAVISRTLTRVCDAVGADALNFAGLEEAQQHDLHARAHLADFVEEDGAVRRHLEQAGLVAVRAGEAAAHVAEELGLEQRVGQAGAVERDQRAGGARAALMNQPGDDFLADAGFTGDQDLGIRPRRALDVCSRLARIASLRPMRRTSAV